MRMRAFARSVVRLYSDTCHTGSSPSGIVFCPTFGAGPRLRSSASSTRAADPFAERRGRIVDRFPFVWHLRTTHGPRDRQNGQALSHEHLLLRSGAGIRRPERDPTARAASAPELKWTSGGDAGSRLERAALDATPRRNLRRAVLNTWRSSYCAKLTQGTLDAAARARRPCRHPCSRSL